MNRSVPGHRPRRPRIELSHLDGLDGLRGLAVAAVVLYHGGLPWAGGGFLGVELFFVLSGFLITSLLIREWLDRGSVSLRGFWARRARRLLPALFVLVVVVGIYYALKGTLGAVPGLFGDGVATLFYYSNWHEIAVGSSYFAQTGPTSPFTHTWSLAIEEQFYVVWPLLVLGVAWIAVRRRGSGRRAAGPPDDAAASRMLLGMLALCLLLLIGSALDSALLFDGGKGLNRVYYGTDTRATGLLSGAALAVGVAWLRLRGARLSVEGSRWMAAVSVGSLAALMAMAVLLVRASGEDKWLYPAGFLLVDALGVSLILAVLIAPRAFATRIFSLRPLRELGRISYGLYLWHFPLFLWLDTPSTGLHGAELFLLRITVALGISIVSYVVVEQPIRQRRLPAWMVRTLAPVTAGAGVVSLALAASASAVPTAATAPGPKIPTTLAGSGKSCTVKLANTPTSGTVAPPKKQEATFQYSALGHGTVTWPAASTTKSYGACPPTRAMIIGDSIAFTIGVPELYNDQQADLAVDDAAILGCAFSTRGELDVNGTWEQPSPQCRNALATWEAQANAFGANEIVFELGYRDEFNWKWDGKLVHLGEPAFDAYVESRIREYIKVLGDGGKRKLLFLTIPFVNPPAQSDGSPAPQASTTRHAEINAMIRKAAATDGQNADVLSIDQVISPSGHYQTDVNGQLCRFDGIHVTVYCSQLLEPKIFTAARTLAKR